MPVPSAITDLSTTAASNYPAGSDSPSTLDDVQRAHASFIAMLRDGQKLSNPVALASAATVDIGAQSSHFVEISGTTGITSFGTTYNGYRILRFTGALLLTHSAGLFLPGAANITTGVGDCLLAVPNLALSGWNVVAYQIQALVPGTATTATTATTASYGSGLVATTRMSFQQTSAPTGWTKDTTHNDKALRVVSGTAGSGGSVAFTTAFASQTPAGTVGNTTLSTAQMPSHTHPGTYARNVFTGGTTAAMVYEDGGSGLPGVSGGVIAEGGGGSHTHSFTGTAINLAVSYVDIILATKD